jgi:RNA polymerase sigma factor (TIGR02999 family)
VPDSAQILTSIDAGDPHAAAELLPLVYDELRRLAAQKMAQEKPGQTLDATGLVHEAYLRLVGPANAGGFEHRGHFFAAAAEAMRRIIIESARRKASHKHGGVMVRAKLHDNLLEVNGPNDDVLAVNEALEQLAKNDPPTVELVKLHYFAGLTLEQAADVLGLTHRTAYRDWAYARAWLYRKLSPGR